MVPLPQIASFEPKGAYRQRVLQFGTPEESVPGQNKIHLSRRLCSSALRLVLMVKFGGHSQALYHEGSCLECAFVTPWKHFSISPKTASMFSTFPSNNDSCQPAKPQWLSRNSLSLLLLSPGLIPRVPLIPRVSPITRVPQSLRRGHEKLECLVEGYAINL